MDAHERRTLSVIRLVLIITSFGAAVAALVLRGRFPMPEAESALKVAFLAQAAFAGVMLLVLKRMIEQPQNAPRRVPLTIVAWAVGESVAVLGALVTIVTAGLGYVIGGVMMFYLSGRIEPRRD